MWKSLNKKNNSDSVTFFLYLIPFCMGARTFFEKLKRDFFESSPINFPDFWYTCTAQEGLRNGLNFVAAAISVFVQSAINRRNFRRVSRKPEVLRSSNFRFGYVLPSHPLL